MSISEAQRIVNSSSDAQMDKSKERLISLISQPLSAFIILANIVLITGFLFNHKLHGTMNWFFLSLLVADLMAGGALPYVPKMSFEKHLSYHHCFFSHVLPNFLFLSFLANLLLMHYAKYTCIVKPLHYRLSWVHRWAVLYISLAWVAPLIFAFMPLAWYQQEPSGKCSFQLVFPLSYLCIETYVLILPVIFAIAVMCIRMLCIAQRQLKDIKNLFHSVNQSQTPTELEQQLELRHTKSIASVSLIFLVCWVPYIVCLNISLFLAIKDSMVRGIVICIGTGSAAIIPVILSLGNYQYTQFWREMATKVWQAYCRGRGGK